MTTKKDLDARAWSEHQTVIVYGQVSKAVWFPPSEDGKHPGVLAAPGAAEARRALKKMAKAFQILKVEHTA